jgi:hypothetical protein
MTTGIKALANLAIACFCFTSAYAFDEPENFAGLKFGEDVRTQMQKCSAPGVDRLCEKGPLLPAN